MSYIGQEARHGAPVLRFDELPLSAPSVEPITLADVKTDRRLDSDDTSQDALIPLLITAAREAAESYTGRRFITQTWRAVMDGFPGVIVPPTPFAAVAAWLPSPQPSPEIPLPFGPVQAVVSIKYLDATTGVQTTLDPAKYVLDTSGVRARIAPSYGSSWPATLPQVGSVELTLRMGYGDAAAQVPAGIRRWLLMRVGTLFENREEVAILQRGKVEELPFVAGLLDPYKMPVI